MRIGLTYITPALAAGAVALAIAAAPIAAAAPSGGSGNQQSCTTSGGSTKCTAPGDVEINASIPAPNPGPGTIYGPFWGG
jgi:hypothetical protein